MQLHRTSPATATYTVESPDLGDMGVTVLPGGAIHIDKPVQILTACELGLLSLAANAALLHRMGERPPEGVTVTTGGEAEAAAGAVEPEDVIRDPAAMKGAPA